MIGGQLRQSYPSPGPVFRYQVDDRDGTARIMLEGWETALTIYSQGTRAQGTHEGWCRTSEGSSHSFASSWVGSALHLWLDGDLFIFEREESAQRRPGQSLDTGADVLAPMPGTVTQILVEVGGSVEPGDRLIIMESMKMELVIDAPRGGVVKRISVDEGSSVDKGMRLLEFEEPGQDG